MITKEEVTRLLFEIIEENEKIPYTQAGYNFLIDELTKKLAPVKYNIDIQPIEEMSVTDRAERKLPNITVSIV